MSLRDSDLNTRKHETDINERKVVSNNGEVKQLEKEGDSDATTQRPKVSAWKKLCSFWKTKGRRKKRKNEKNAENVKTVDGKNTLQESDVEGLELQRRTVSGSVTDKARSVTSQRDSKLVDGKENEYYGRGEYRKLSKRTKNNTDDQEEKKLNTRKTQTEKDIREYSDTELDRERISQQRGKSGRVSQNDSNFEIDDYDYRRNKVPKIYFEDDSASEINLGRNKKPRRDIREDSDTDVEKYAPRRTKINRRIGSNCNIEVDINRRSRKITQQNVCENSDKEIDSSRNCSGKRHVSEDNDIDTDSRRSIISQRHEVCCRETENRYISRPRLKWINSETQLEQNQKSMRVSNDCSHCIQNKHDSERSWKSRRLSSESVAGSVRGSASTKNLRNICERSNERPVTSSKSYSRCERDPHYIKSQNIPILKSLVESVSSPTIYCKSRSKILGRSDSRKLCLRDSEMAKRRIPSRESFDSIIEINICPRDRKHSQVSVYNIIPKSSGAFSSPRKTRRSNKQNVYFEQGSKQGKRGSSVRSNSKRKSSRVGERRGINVSNKRNTNDRIKGTITISENDPTIINDSTGDDLETENVFREEFRAKDSSNSKGVLKQSSEKKPYATRHLSKIKKSTDTQKKLFADNSESERCVQDDGCEEGNTDKCAEPPTGAKRKRGSAPSKRQNCGSSPACSHLLAAQSPYPFSHYPSADPSLPSCRHTPCFHASRLPPSCPPLHGHGPTRCTFPQHTWSRVPPPTATATATGPRPAAEALSPAVRPGDITNLLQQALGRNSCCRPRGPEGTGGRGPSHKRARKPRQLSPSSSRTR